MSSKSGILFRATRSGRKNLQSIQKESLHASRQQAAPPVTIAKVPLDQHVESEHDITRSVDTARPMHELEGPPGWPVVGNFLTYLKKENQGKIHHVQSNYHKKFGPMFREKWGPKWQVHLSDPDLIEHIYRNQGQYPNRPSIQVWNLIKTVQNLPLGISSSQGEDWHRNRSQLDKKLMDPAECAQFYEPVHQVSIDLIPRLRQVRDTEGSVDLTKALHNELYFWGLECSGVLLFEKRLGCVDVNHRAETRDFLNAVTEMFETSQHLIVGEKLHQALNTSLWRRHSAAWDKIIAIAKSHIQEKLERLKAHEGSDAVKQVGGQISGCPFHHASSNPSQSKEESTFLGDIIKTGKMTLPEIYSNFTDIMIAGADTTSTTLCFMLHLLATHPEKQSRLLEEIEATSRKEGEEANLVGHMPYLDCILKETLRMYPVISMQCRILDNDLVVNGYNIPAKTMFVLNHYASSRDPNVFEDPDEFKPERWERDGNRRIKHHPFASMPFGFGRRTCIGRRFARMQIHSAMSQILKNFKVKPIEGMKFEPQVRILLTSGEQVPIRFIDR